MMPTIGSYAPEIAVNVFESSNRQRKTCANRTGAFVCQLIETSCGRVRVTKKQHFSASG